MLCSSCRDSHSFYKQDKQKCLNKTPAEATSHVIKFTIDTPIT